VQAAFGASAPPQVVLEPKSPAFVPVMLVPLIVSDAFPVLVTITTCGFEDVAVVWLPKVSAAMLNDTCGADGTPVP
jgi:hypothetical protein